MRVLLLAAVLGLGLCAAWWWLRSASLDGADALLAETVQVERAPERVVSTDRASDELSETSTQLSTRALEPTATPDSFRAEIRVVRATIGERLPDDAHVRVHLTPTGESTGFALDAPGGEWSGELARRSFDVRAATVNGVVQRATCDQRLSPETPRVEVVVHASEAWLLEVVDAETGRELHGVSVVALDSTKLGAGSLEVFFENRTRPPVTDVVRVVENARSPLPLPEGDGGCYWVTAHGYGWAPFLRDRNQTHVRVRLARAGSLELRVSAFDTQRFGEVRLDVAESGAAVLEVSSRSFLHPPWTLFGGEVIVLDAIPAEEYVVTAKLRSRDGIDRVLWHGFATVTPSEKTVVDVDLNQRPAQKPCILVVGVVAPAVEWQEAVSSITLWRARPSGGWERVGRDRTNDWQAADGSFLRRRKYIDLEPGEYVVQAEPAGLEESFTLAPGEDREIALDCQATASLVIHVESDVPIEQGVVVHWGSSRSDRISNPWVPVGRDGRVRLRTLLEPLSIQAVGETTASPRVEVTPELGKTTEVTLRMTASNAAWVRVSVWRNGSAVAVGSDYWSEASVEAAGHAGRLLKKTFGTNSTSVEITPGSHRPDPSRAVFVLSAPGPYVFRFDGATPYTQAGTRVIEVDAKPGVSDVSVFLD